MSIFTVRSVSDDVTGIRRPYFVAQQPHGPFEGVGRIVVRLASPLECQQLVFEHFHTARRFFRLVEKNLPALEKGLQRLDACEFLRFFPSVPGNGDLLSRGDTRFAELVHQQVLNEIGLHVIPDGRIPHKVAYLVMPPHHDRHLRLVGVSLYDMELPLFGQPHQKRGLEVVFRRRFERRVGIRDDCAVFPQGKHLAVADILPLENGPFVQRVVHVFLLKAPFADFHSQVVDFRQLVILPPGRFPFFVEGIHNSILVETEEKNYTDLKKLSFIIMWLAGMCSAVMLCLYQPFMRLWVTEKRMLPFAVVVCMVVYFFISQVNQILITYKDAAGIWHEDRFRPLVTALVNLVLNIILVQFIGIYGVILSTVISVLAVGMPWILHNLFTVLFKRNAWEYIRKLLYYTIVTTIVCTLTYLVASQIPGVGILALILKAIVSVIVSNLLLFVAYFKMGEFAEVKKLVIRVLKRQA